MKRWNTFRDAQVSFIENHWQTKDAMKLYIHLIKLAFSNKMNIGLMLDKASMHDCKGLLEHVEINKNMPTFIHIGFVTENLTSVYSPPDLVVIKISKLTLEENMIVP